MGTKLVIQLYLLFLYYKKSIFNKMKKKVWIPMLVLYFLFSIFFVENIGLDVDNENQCQSEIESTSINDFGEEELGLAMKESFVDLEDFEDFLYGLGNKPLYKHSELYFDTTGDGSKELVKETVALNGDICEVNQEIYKEGKLIWGNTIRLNHTDLKTMFGNHEAIKNIAPYALFYLGLTISPFIEKMENNSLYDDRSKRIIRNHLEDSDLDISEMYNSEVGEQISDYKGYFIFKRNPGQNSIYMWDELKQEFIQVYKNNYFTT